MAKAMTLRQRVEWILANRPGFASVRDLTVKSQMSPAALSNQIRSEDAGEPVELEMRTYKKVAGTARVSLSWFSTGLGDPEGSDVPDAPAPKAAPARPVAKASDIATSDEAKREALRRFPELGRDKRYGVDRALAACWLVDRADYKPSRAHQRVELVGKFDEGLSGTVAERAAKVANLALEHEDVRSAADFPPGAKPVASRKVARGRRLPDA